MSAVASRLRLLAGVKVFTRQPAKASSPAAGRAAARLGDRVSLRIVAIGASTGGPQALGKLLAGLGPTFPWPILCVQHMSPGFLEGMIAWLNSQTRLGVRVASKGERPVAGQVYFAPEDLHLRLNHDGLLSLERGEKIDGHRPSATALLRSVAEVYGSAAVGVLLTGMGSDGALGLLELARVGAMTLAQDEETSVVFGMPRQAMELGAVKQGHSLDEIGARLRLLAEGRQ